MPDTTTRFGIVTPTGVEAPDVDQHMQNIANQIDLLGAIFGQGTFAARPTSSPGQPGKQGRFYMVTSGAETGELYYDYGTGWILVNPDATIAADSITAGLIAPNAVTSSELADNAVDTAAIQDGAVTGPKVAATLKPSGGAGAATEALRALGLGDGLALGQAQITNINRAGLLSARPAANTVPVGTKFFATDQVVEYISDGAAWSRLGLPAGHGGFYMANAAPAGYVLYDGTALPNSAGIYADLAAHLGGTATPNMKRRVPIGRDSAYAPMDTIGELLGSETVSLGEVKSNEFAPGASSAVVDVADSASNIQPSIVVNFIAKL